ncbi:MAG: DNA repair protein RadC [Oscillospiraceae bacterium]|nr:DNA repair protein RadC [Oscillospiraceae bacterium]
MLKLKELPILERPYEKLELYGAEKLSNAELLGIIIKSGTKNETAVSLAQRILSIKMTNEKDELRFLHEITIEEFMNIKGIGKVKAIQLKALCELTKRMSAPVHNNNIIIKSTIDIVNLFMEELRYEKREIVKLVALSSKNVILRIINISYGGTNLAVVEPKEVLLEAIKMQAPRIILLHNHPSGDPTPSKEDYRITERISDCAELLGIDLLDHIVIGDGTYRSILCK